MISTDEQNSKKKIEQLFERYLNDYTEHGLLWSDFSEQDTATKYIKPLIEALGWNVTDMRDMREQVPLDQGKNFVDCILYSQGKPYVVIDYKSLSSGPIENKIDDINKLLNIAKKLQAKFAVMTRFCETVIYDSETGQELRVFAPVDYKDSFEILWKMLSKPSCRGT